MSEPLLEVRDLVVEFEAEEGVVRAVDGVSFSVAAGRTLGIVGESGAGKSAATASVLGLTRLEGARVSGRVLLEGRDLLALPEEELRRVRGGEVALVPQDPLSALHPLLRVGDQLAEAVRAHGAVSRAAARARALELLGRVGVPDPRVRLRQHPHELSGGLRQRVMIAMALVNDPKVLIADEPTTALDVTVQAQVLDLVRALQDETGMAVVLVTHDLGVVAEVADEVAVMYAGRVVERGSVEELFLRPQHPYTWGLLGAVPRLDAPAGAELAPIPGRPPSPGAPPGGCRFHPRCTHVRDRHRTVDPRLEPVPGEPGHAVACLLAPEERRALWARRR